MRWKQNDSSPAGGNRRRRLIAAAGLTAFVLAMAAICLMAGKPMLALLSDPERFRDWVDERGLWGRAAFVGMMSLQIIAAMIPGEPLEIAAGYAFGAAEGTALCLLGALLAVPAFAEGGASGPLDTINNLSDLVFQCVRAVGVIVAGYGIVQIGLAVQSHDSSQRANGFLAFFGGLLIMFAKEILDFITV